MQYLQLYFQILFENECQRPFCQVDLFASKRRALGATMIVLPLRITIMENMIQAEFEEFNDMIVIQAVENLSSIPAAI